MCHLIVLAYMLSDKYEVDIKTLQEERRHVERLSNTATMCLQDQSPTLKV